MAGQTLTAADAILKELYVSPIVEQLNQKKYLLEQIERDSEKVSFTGRKAVFPVHKGRNTGRRSIGDGMAADVARSGRPREGARHRVAAGRQRRRLSRAGRKVVDEERQRQVRVLRGRYGEAQQLARAHGKDLP